MVFTTNVVLSRKDYCSFEGDCNQEFIYTNVPSLCLYCIFREDINIPKIIEERKKEKCG